MLRTVPKNVGATLASIDTGYAIGTTSYAPSYLTKRFQKIRESSETTFFCQYPTSRKGLKGVAWEEKVASRSGRSCCIICQNELEYAMTRESMGASQMLLL